MKVFLSGGGTAGHVNPALAIGQEIKKRIDDVQLFYVGTPRGIENELVKDMPMYHINIQGIRRKLTLENIKTAILTVRSFSKARKLLKKERPDVVIGTGGYVSWPICSAAASLGIPCFLHESNSVPGLVVRKLQNKVNGVFVNFEATAEKLSKKANIYHVGTPVREAFKICDREKEREAIGAGSSGKYNKVLLSFGGSLGATRLNSEMLALMNHIAKLHPDWLIIHATGKREYQMICDKASQMGIDKLDNCRIMEYINDIPAKMVAADLIICRSGALTLSELAYTRSPSILIPSPNVTDDQQYKNASVFEKAGAAVVIRESELTEGMLSNKVEELLSDVTKLQEMRERSSGLAVMDSGDRICDIIMKEIKAK